MSYILFWIDVGPNNNVDEGRSGSGGLDSSPSLHPNLYGSHATGNRATNNNSPPTPSGQQMLVVPQPVKSNNNLTGVPATNGTGRKYQCKMCPQVRLIYFFFINSFIFFQILFSSITQL